MADIDVVPKHGGHVWLWVVLIAVAFVLLFWVFRGRTNSAASIERLGSPEVAHAPLTDSPSDSLRVL
jgi:hypothetical protein